MASNVTRMKCALQAALMIGLSGAVMAQETTTVLLDTRDSLLPKRWCIETHMATPSLAMLLEPREPTIGPWYMPDRGAFEYSFHEDFANRSSISYRLAEIDGGRLITFWKGNSLGIFLGVTKGGFVSLSIAQ